MTTTQTAVRITIPAPAALLTTNRERRAHWATRAEIVAQWRHAAAVLARADKLPAFARAEVTFNVHQAKGVLADAGGHNSVTKAVLDGLRDAGVLEDDDPEHVTAIIHRAPVRGADAVTVTLRGILKHNHQPEGVPHG